MKDIIKYLKTKPLLAAIFICCLNERNYKGASARLSLKRQFEK